MKRFFLLLITLLAAATASATAGPGDVCNEAIRLGGDVKVYKGTSTYSGDIAYHYDGLLTATEFVAVFYVVCYVF